MSPSPPLTAATRWRRSRLPVTDAPIFVECSLEHFLLKRMLSDLGFVDFNAESRQVSRSHQPALPLDAETLAHHILSPRHIEMNGFADDVGGGGESKFQ